MITIKQIEQIEKFIAEIEALKNSEQNGNDFYDAARNIDRTIAASGIGYKSTIDWSNSSFYDYIYEFYNYNDYQIATNLEIIKMALQGILNAQPYYDRILEIRQTIYDIENASDGSKRDIIMQAVEEYNDVIHWDIDDPIDDVELVSYEIISKLNKYIRKLPDEFGREKLDNQPSSAINIVQTNSQISNQTVSFSIQQSIQELEDCEKIDSAELEYIKTQLKELQQLLESKRRGGKVREKVSVILKWLADKTTDVMIAVLPALITGLKG